jgi:hypothetical protein
MHHVFALESLNGSQSHQTVKHGRESSGTRNQELLCWRGPAEIMQSVIALSFPSRQRTQAKELHAPFVKLGLPIAPTLTARKTQCTTPHSHKFYCCSSQSVTRDLSYFSLRCRFYIVFFLTGNMRGFNVSLHFKYDLR